MCTSQDLLNPSGGTWVGLRRLGLWAKPWGALGRPLLSSYARDGPAVRPWVKFGRACCPDRANAGASASSLSEEMHESATNLVEPRSQTPVWERLFPKLLFRAARNRSFAAERSQTGVWEPGETGRVRREFYLAAFLLFLFFRVF